MPTLFASDRIIGVFRGFQQGGLEFHADLVLPYRNEFQSIPMHGQFLLVQLETPDEAVVGRIASLSADGRLAHGSGEEFNIRAVRENRAIPEDLREQYLKYRVNIRVLGVLRRDQHGKVTFVASHRRLPHVGSPVAFPSDEILQELAGHHLDGAAVGHLAFGEYIYAHGSDHLEQESWMQVVTPLVLTRFPIESLVSRRSFIFARAGFGKSNLNKLLFSSLYETSPTVEKRGGRRVPVGTVIFDPDGEYFWPDDRGRPGLCDVKHLQDQLVVFTSRQAPSDFYGSFVAGGIKLDIRRLRPSDVIAIALEPERQDQQNVRKLRSLNPAKWTELVNLIHEYKYDADLNEVKDLLNLEQDRQLVEALAARANMVTVVRMLHDPSSQLMDLLMQALKDGKLCVVDVSQLGVGQAFVLSGLILRRIFDQNQQGFTKAQPDTVPTIAVIEEAQAVLGGRASASNPYIAWVKEGRKYDLGAVLVTQQPGSIPIDILSQGDNWFLFHLLSSTDLTNVRRANAHFSDDLLSSLLNEPIPGQGVFWSSAGGKPYPLSIRALSFEAAHSVQDPTYQRPSLKIYASRLRDTFMDTVTKMALATDGALHERVAVASTGNGRHQLTLPTDEESIGDQDAVDVLALYEAQAVEALRASSSDMERMERGEGVAWGAVMARIREALPNSVHDKEQLAYDLVPKVLNSLFGAQDRDWHSYKHPQRQKTYVKCGPH